MVPTFLFFDSWGLFTLNVSMGKKVMARGPRGGHQSGTVNYFFRRCFRKNLNCGQCINDKQITFCVLQIWDKLSLNHNQNNLVGFLGLPITAPSNKPWFWQFFKIFGKTRDIFLKYFSILCTTWDGSFFPVLSRVGHN